ncbi:MAG TPA: PIN domain-containing protein [Thermoanaerobaculia bacterium]|nr:PIN domain-containing protein [Thermoanaerobaculia bacterium]
MILLDSSGLVAALVASEYFHDECSDALLNAEPPLILSPFVLAETDFLLQKFEGIDVELSFLEQVADRAYELVVFTNDEITAARQLIAKYRTLKIGLADASVAVLAAKFNCFDVLTLDARHFRAIRPVPRKHFRILPADA